MNKPTPFWSAINTHAKAFVFLAACGTLLGKHVVAQTPPLRAIQGIATVDSLVSAEFAKDSVGALTVGIISGPQLIWTRTVGYADIQTRKLASRNTVYRIGSVTKPFTAVMLLQLVASGRVKLSDPVEKIFPEVKQIPSKPVDTAPITFMQLATMASGLEREPREEGPFWTGPVSSWEKTLLAALPHTRYASRPGTEYLYSNIGYAILGAALARAANMSYTTWQQLRVFNPLGMTRTRFDVDTTIASDLATGYEVASDGTLNNQTAAQELRAGRGYKVPNGAIFSTVDDLARFVSFELGFAPDSVLKRSVLDDAFKSYRAADHVPGSPYGLGFMALQRDGYPYFGHSGSVAGYRVSMYYDRTRKIGVVVFRNVGGGKQSADRLAVDLLSMLAAKN